MIIEDGTGTGQKVQVDDEYKMATFAVTLTEEAHTNDFHGEAYHLVFVCSGLLPGAPFIYIKNTDSSKNMILEGISLHTEANAIITVVKKPTVTTVTGTANVPVNVNVGAGNLADGTFYTCKSGAVSGVTGGTVMSRIYCCSGCGQEDHNFECDIVVQKNNEVAIFTENVAAISGCNIAGLIPLYFHT